MGCRITRRFAGKEGMLVLGPHHQAGCAGLQGDPRFWGAKSPGRKVKERKANGCGVKKGGAEEVDDEGMRKRRKRGDEEAWRGRKQNLQPRVLGIAQFPFAM